MQSQVAHEYLLFTGPSAWNIISRHPLLPDLQVAECRGAELEREELDSASWGADHLMVEPPLQLMAS